MITYSKALMLDVAPKLDQLGRVIEFPEGDVYIFDEVNTFEPAFLKCYSTAYFIGNNSLKSSNKMSKTHLMCYNAIVMNNSVLKDIISETAEVDLYTEHLTIACKVDNEVFVDFLIHLAKQNLESTKPIESIELNLYNIGITKEELFEYTIYTLNEILMNPQKRNSLRYEMMYTMVILYNATKDERYIDIVKCIAERTYKEKKSTHLYAAKAIKAVGKVKQYMGINIY